MSIKEQTCNFINNTDFPIMVDGLIHVMSGLNKLGSILVMPHEECTITSITGEWFLNTFFQESEYKKPWTINKMSNYYSIGKFRNTPCVQGDYSWMDYDDFTVSFDGDVFKFNYMKA